MTLADDPKAVEIAQAAIGSGFMHHDPTALIAKHVLTALTPILEAREAARFEAGKREGLEEAKQAAINTMKRLEADGDALAKSNSPDCSRVYRMALGCIEVRKTISALIDGSEKESDNG